MNSRRLLALAICAVTFALFWQTRQFEFTHYDDDLFVSENPHIQQGLTVRGILWALGADLVFESANADYWQPVTFISRMIDIQLWGLHAGGHHLTNLFFHLVNIVLVIWVLWAMGASPAVISLVAAIFAWHPMQVDSVAWVTERKDLLSLGFMLAALLFYFRYARGASSKYGYAAAAAYALSLMSKPYLVTLPVLLLILDRFLFERPPGRLIREKWLFWAMAFFVVVLDLHSHYVVNNYARQSRWLDAPVMVWRYLGKFFVPQNLAVVYPDTPAAPIGVGLAAAAALAAVTIGLWRITRQDPLARVGWAWFLVTLAPLAGATFENRRLYVPIIGLALTLFQILIRRAPPRRIRAVVYAVSALLCAALAVISYPQIGTWRNDKILFEHALKVTQDNPIAHNSLANAYFHEGNYERALDELTQALFISPQYLQAHINLGGILMKLQRYGPAEHHYSIAYRMAPRMPSVNCNLAMAYLAQGREDEAITHFRRTLAIDPYYESALLGLADTLNRQGRWQEAAEVYERLISFYVDADILNNYAVALSNLGRFDQAKRFYRQALELNADLREAKENLARLGG